MSPLRRPEYLGQFRTVTRGFGAGVEQSIGEPVEQRGIAVVASALDDFEFPFPPFLRRLITLRRGVHRVIAELG